jgi:hypothetical protein
MRHRPHHGDLVHDLGRSRQQLAHAQAGDRRRNRADLAAHLGDRIGLRVERLVLRRRTVEEDEDARFRLAEVRRRAGPISGQREVIRQPEPHGAEAADREELAA